MRLNAWLVPCVLVIGSAWACSGSDADARVRSSSAAVAPRGQPETGVLGTIRADLDGQAHTWYVVDGEVDGKPYASGMFMARGDGYLVSIGGFDTAEPPLDTFGADFEAGNVSFGDYEGSAFNLMVRIPAGQSSTHVELGPTSTEANLAYMPVASLDDVIAGTLFVQSGTLDVETARFADGTAAVTGTFAGELALMDESLSVTVTNGRFEVERLPQP